MSPWNGDGAKAGEDRPLDDETGAEPRGGRGRRYGRRSPRHHAAGGRAPHAQPETA
jgi:hypothetical protein